MDFYQTLLADQQKTIELLTHEHSLARAESAKREEALSKQIEVLLTQNQELIQEVANLRETLRTFAGHRFAPSSEKSKDRQVDGQLDLGFFNEAEYISDETIPEPTIDDLISEEPGRKKARKPRGSREDIYSNLPIREEVYSLPADSRGCELCNSEMVSIGKEYVREEIRIIPAQVERIHIYRESYICNECKAYDEVSEIKKAPVPLPLLKHSLASPSIVSHIMYQKYANALPLNRQEKDFARLGVNLKRSVQANWVNSTAVQYLCPVFDRLHEELVLRDILMSDETPCQVHNEEGKSATSKSYMWIHRTGNDGLPTIVLYDYQPSRNGDHAANFLKGFKGYHQCDGFSGYNKLKESVIRVACLAHIRRKFMEAVPKKRTGDKPIPAEVGVLFCNKLFKLEEEFAELPPEERKTKRLEQSKPVLDAFWSWLDSQNPPNGSSLYKAVTYARNQKEYMNNFLLDGRCEISNALTENSVRPYTLIRKNSLFHDTPKGAEASAIICSLMETAKASGLDVQKYLEHLLIKMPGCLNEPAGIEDLLPWSKNIQKLCALNSK